VYFPADYAEVGVGSLLSGANREGITANQSEPPLVADYFTHWTEFPRWSVVSHSLGEQALLEFLDRPSEPPESITWEPD
jgi:Immunity protein Imm1